MNKETTNQLEIPTEETITGYQWGDDMSYIGAYQFERNLDQMAIHLPPRTTLQPPPAGLAIGKEAAYDEDQAAWVVRNEDLSWMDEASRAAYLASQVAA